MDSNPGRREFIRNSTAGLLAIGGATQLASAATSAQEPAKKIKVAIIGCGSVSRVYFPHLQTSKYVEIVSACDIIPERAEGRAKQFNVPNHYPNIEALLEGAPFDLLVNLTDMQAHERLNRRAIEAGKHVWSEKPIANSLAAAKELVKSAQRKNVRIWGAPTVVNSPQFAFMVKALQEKKIGKVSAAHASYGHGGPTWSPFFYTVGGGSMPDLAVYQLTYLTGLLGPAKSVVAMTSVVTPEREIVRTVNGVEERSKVKVVAEDNAMVLMDHGDGVLSHVQSGFNYFTAQEHDHVNHEHRTVTIMGNEGTMCLAGYDWAPKGVDLASHSSGGKFERHAADAQGYLWEQGATIVAETLATGKEPLFTPEHCLHVLEVMIAAKQSQTTGKRISISTSFKWPLVV